MKWKDLYDLSPDFSGILLAAVGVALVVAPDWITKFPKWLRWTAAALLVLLGLFGLGSSFVQRRENDKSQSALTSQITGLTQTVKSYGPKLDDILAEPCNPKQKSEALALKSQWQMLKSPDNPAHLPPPSSPIAQQPRASQESLKPPVLLDYSGGLAPGRPTTIILYNNTDQPLDNVSVSIERFDRSGNDDPSSVFQAQEVTLTAVLPSKKVGVLPASMSPYLGQPTYYVATITTRYQKLQHQLYITPDGKAAQNLFDSSTEHYFQQDVPAAMKAWEKTHTNWWSSDLRDANPPR